MIHGFLLATDALRAVFLSQADLVLENLALRQHLAALGSSSTGGLTPGGAGGGYGFFRRADRGCATRGSEGAPVPKRKLTVDDLRFLVAVSRVALEKLQNESPAASETVLLALALEKMEGCARVVEA